MAGINVSDARPAAWIVSGNAFRFLLTEVKEQLAVGDPLQLRLGMAMDVGWLDLAASHDIETQRLAELIQDESQRLIAELTDAASDFEAKLADRLAQLVIQLQARDETPVEPSQEKDVREAVIRECPRLKQLPGAAGAPP